MKPGSSFPPPARPPTVPPFRKKRILVVDDDEGTRGAIAHLLNVEFDVSVAADGVEGLEIATGPTPPDLVIADVWMPRLDGIEMVRRMKQIESLHHVPVVFLTGQTSPMSVVAGIAAGARHYLAKPVDAGLLEQKVRKALSG